VIVAVGAGRLGAGAPPEEAVVEEDDIIPMLGLDWEPETTKLLHQLSCTFVNKDLILNGKFFNGNIDLAISPAPPPSPPREICLGAAAGACDEVLKGAPRPVPVPPPPSDLVSCPFIYVQIDPQHSSMCWSCDTILVLECLFSLLVVLQSFFVCEIFINELIFKRIFALCC